MAQAAETEAPRSRLPAVWEVLRFPCDTCGPSAPHDAIAQEGSVAVLLKCRGCGDEMRAIR